MNDYVERFGQSWAKVKSKEKMSLLEFIAYELKFFEEYISNVELELETEVVHSAMLREESKTIHGYIDFLYSKMRDYADSKTSNSIESVVENNTSLNLKVNKLKKSIETLEEDSNEEDFSIVERLLALNELGVIEYLKKMRDPYHISNNGLAKAISSIVGSSTSNINRYLRVLDNVDVGPKNDMYAKIQTVNKVKLSLKNNGFTPIRN